VRHGLESLRAALDLKTEATELTKYILMWTRLALERSEFQLAWDCLTLDWDGLDPHFARSC